MITRHWMSGILVAAAALLSTVAVATASANAPRATATPANTYCDPLGGCKTLHASPSKVKPGKKVTISGTVGTACKSPATVTIYSSAFKGAKHNYKGVPAVTTRSKKGRFSTRITIHKVKAKAYTVQARCGKRSVARTKLTVL